MKKILTFLIVTVVLVACKKEEDRSCLKSIGDESTKVIELNDFDKLELGPHLRYQLVQDTINYVELTGGINLLNFVEADVADQTLTMTNDNECNFLRSYDEIIIAKIHYKKIINIHFEGTYEIDCLNTMNTDYLTLTIKDGAGEVNLDVNAYAFYVGVEHGWGNFNLSGNVNYLNIRVKDNGFGSANNLNVMDSVDVISKTADKIEVNVEGCQFRAQTLSNGSIYYIGAPASIEFNKYGSGDLIDNN